MKIYDLITFWNIDPDKDYILKLVNFLVQLMFGPKKISLGFDLLYMIGFIVA